MKKIWCMVVFDTFDHCFEDRHRYKEKKVISFLR